MTFRYREDRDACLPSKSLVNVTKTTTQMPSNDAPHIVDVLKKHYQKRYLERTKKKFKFTDDLEEIHLWAQIAANCRELKADPVEFIDAAFAAIDRQKYPYTRVLTGAPARNWWKAWKKNKEDAISREVEYCLYYFAAAEKQIQSFIDRRMPRQSEHDVMHWFLRSVFAEPPHVAGVLAYPEHPEILMKHLKETQQYYRDHPEVAEAVRKKYPKLSAVMVLPCEGTK